MSSFFMSTTALFAFGVSGMLQAGDLAAQQQYQQSDHSINGVITELDDNELTLRTDNQQSMTVLIVEETQVLGNAGWGVGLQEDELLGLLDSGQRIVVNYRTSQEGEHTAMSIEKWTAEMQQAQREDGQMDRRDFQAQQRQEQGQTQTSQTQNSMTGTVTATTGNRLTLRTYDQQSTTVRVNEQTRILDESGQRVEARDGDLLGSFDSGDQIVVNFRSGDNATERTAVSIENRAVGSQQAQWQGAQQQEQLPGTSSALPIVALFGLLGLAGAGALSVAARRQH